MKNKLKLPIFIIAAVLAVNLFALISCSAAQVNSHEVKKDDTVTYSVHAIACPTKIRAIDVSVYYDSTSLEYVEGSLSTPDVKGAVTNTELDGEIRFNAITLDGFSFSEDSILATMTFTVKDDSATDITLYSSIKNFLDEGKNDLKDTFVYDLTEINSSAASEVESAPTGTDNTSSVPNDTGEGEVIIDLSSSKATEEDVSSNENDIPSDMAISFETKDVPTPTNERPDNTKLYLLAGVFCALIIIPIIVIIVALTKNRSKGSHFAK